MLSIFVFAVFCGSQAFATQAVVGQTFMAGSQDPRTGSTGWALISHGIAEKLFTVNAQGEIVGQIAKSVTKISTTEWDVTLKTGYKFSDGSAVNAAAVAACLTELNTDNSAAATSLGTMTVTAPSTTVVKIKSSKVSHVITSVLAEWAFPIYKRTGTNFVYTGPYKVKEFTAGTHILLDPNTHYPDGKGNKRFSIKLEKFAGGDALATGVEQGKVDVGFHLPIGKVADLNKKAGITVKSFEVGYHYMMFHNTNHTQMEKGVRQAIDLAIDRSALVTALAGGKATRSLFPDFSPYYSTSGEITGDATAAGTALTNAGWTLVNGKRTKNGNILNLTLVAYPQRPGLPIMQPLIASSLTALGITVTQITTSASSWDQLDAIMASGDYDLLMWAQNTLPSGDPYWFLNRFFHSTEGGNYAKISNAGIDAKLATLSTTEGTARVAACKTAHDAILAEVPVSNLVTPAWHVGLSTKLKDYTPWGSDYYVIRSDFPVDSSKSSAAHLTTSCAAFLIAISLFGLLA